MKKITILLLVVALLCSSIPGSLATGYHDQVLPLLAEKLQLPPEAINLDGSLVDLPLSGKQLWMGRYYTGEAAAEKPVIDDPDAPVSSDEALAGVVYLDTSTGKLLSDEEARLYFEEEDKLRQAEYERLAGQSGKIDPYFYAKIFKAAAGDLLEVMIWLRYQETEAMQEAMRAIIKDYPDLVEKGMVPPEFGGELLLVPRIDAGSDAGGGVSGAYPGEAEGAKAPELPGDGGASDGEFQILPYPVPEPMPLPAEERKEAEEREPLEDINWARYEEMMNRLAAVRPEGYRASLEAAAQALAEMGASYEVLEGNVGVTCTLTAEQILSLKDADYIDTINENAPVSLYAVDLAADGRAAAAEAEQTAAEKAAFPWLLIPVLLLLSGGGAVYFYRHQKRKAAGNL